MRNDQPVSSTKESAYAKSLLRKQTAWWKRVLDVQAPYRWNIRRLVPGFVLDIGCGMGRNMDHLNGNGVGIDHNPEFVEISRRQGLVAFTPEEFEASGFNVRERFDSLLLAHVAEHMTERDVVKLLETYLPLLKRSGKLILICPQEAGFKKDSTHVEFMDFEKLLSINEALGLKVFRSYSFPFPRSMGSFFLYNEFITVSYKAIE